MKQLRVTLVSGLGAYTATSPNDSAAYAPPLGILTLAARVRESFPVSIVDLDHIWRCSGYVRTKFQPSIVEAICATRPDVLGFSSISGSYPLTIRLAGECSRLIPGATILFGGPQATVTDLETLHAFPFVDMIVRGEADDTFPALLSAFATDSPIAGTPGLTYRDRARVRRNPSAPAVLDLDHVELPAYDLVPDIEKLSAFPLEIGRGCPYACTFCSTNDFFRRRFRLKSPARTLEDMNRLHETWGTTTFDLVHDMFTIDRHKVVAFCQTMIDAGSPYKWSCSARTDSVDCELLCLMKQAGCHDIFFGVETGSRRMQRIIDKDLDIEQARQVIQINSDLGIHTTASLIVGYPQEAREDLRDTVAFFASVMVMPWADPQLNVLSPLASTPITDQYIGELTLDDNWADISENGTLQDAIDKLLIAVHPGIFPNFYAFPYFTNRDLLRRLRGFLFYGMARCGALMRALYLETRDLFDAFERWDTLFRDASPQWFASLDFVHALISFCETTCAESRSVLAMARFTRGVYARSASLQTRHIGTEPHLVLSDDFVLVACDCDVNAVINAMMRGVQPDPAAFETAVTVGVRVTSLNRASIFQFPPVTLDLLRHAEKASTLVAIERDFEERGISLSGLPPCKVVLGGIEYLEKLRLVRRVYQSGQPPFAEPGGVKALTASA